MKVSVKETYSSIRPLVLTMFVFGLPVWLYVVAIQLVYPEWLGAPLSHVRYPPFNWRVDEIGMLGFAVSAFGFFVWQLENERS